MKKPMQNYLAIGLVAFCFSSVSAMADNSATLRNQSAVAQQANAVRGHVVDENGEPLIGVTVKVVGSNVGAVTDLDGYFVLNDAEGKDIQLSYTGYKTQTIKAGRGTLNIKMEPDALGLDEVVVIGFGTVKKRDLTGSVAQIKSEAILQTPTSSVASALQGRITGLDVNGSEMRIRGNRSINGSNDPLVIIDGVQGGALSDLNPDDIENIDVLKDASSTAIYGSQGANGVIIVTTKKAEAGRFQISYNGYVTGAFRQQHPDYRSGQNYFDARKLAAQNAGNWSSEADDINLFGGSPEALAAYKAGAWTNYEDEVQKNTTWSTQHSLTLSGGNEKTTARFSVGYANDGSKWKNSGGTDRYTLRAHIDHNIRKWISGGVTFQLTHNRSERSPYEEASTTDMQLGSPYGYYDYSSGKYMIGTEMVERPLDAGSYVNPLVNTLNGDRYSRETYGTNVVANGYLDIHPIEGLSFRSQFNTHITNASDGSFQANNSATQLYNGTNLSTATESKANSLYTEWNNILTYNFTMLPEGHHLGMTALTTWGKKTYDILSATSYGQTMASNLWWNLASNDGGAGHVVHSSAYTKEQNFSYAFRVNYDWNSRYLFTASIRRDGASRLAEGHKWDTFPSAAIAWRISDEPFMKNTKSWLDDLKIRATYGVTGNAGIGVYGTQSGVTFDAGQLGFQDKQANHYWLGVKTSSDMTGEAIIGNPDTKWERSTTFDLGFDMMLFNNRVSVTFDWYNTKTTDLILLRTLPTSSGNDGKFSTYTNIGATRNRGWELTVNSRNIVTKDFQWNSTLSFSKNNEEILELAGGEDMIQIGNKPEEVLMVGYPIKSYRTYIYQGIWQTSEADEAAKYFTDKDHSKPFKPGDIKVADLDGDNWIDTGDYTIVGSQTPKWFMGFNNDFRYKNFDLNIYIYTRWGHWGDNPLANFTPSNGGRYTTMDYWVAGSNEGGSFPALMQNYNFYDYKGYTAYWYCDQSFIKLKRIALGYTLPRPVTNKWGIEKLRVYATVNNPFYIVKEDWMKEFDPEGQQRSITFGLNVNF